MAGQGKLKGVGVQEESWRGLSSLHKSCSIKNSWKRVYSTSYRLGVLASLVQQTDAAGEQLPPWLLGFQCNERYLKWDDSAQIQLLKIHAARELEKVLIQCKLDCRQHCSDVPVWDHYSMEIGAGSNDAME